jgi:hypothetical protein
VAPDHDEDDLRWDDTVRRAPSAPATAPVRALPDLDDTIVSASAAPRSAALAATPDASAAGSARPSAAPAASASAAPDGVAGVPRLVLPDGAEVELGGGTVYLGRNPALPRVPAAGVPVLVRLESARREVSSTHLAVTALGGAIVVRDMLSTNGTVVKTPGVAARTLLRGESATVTPGTTLDLGDGNVIEVRR